MKGAELFQRLVNAELKQIEICNERVNIWCELAKTFSGISLLESKLPEFRTKLDGIKFILNQYPEGLHVSELVEKLSALKVLIKKNDASGIMRRYVTDGKYFEALGGNRFKLKEELLSKNK